MPSATTATIVMNNPCFTETSSYSSWASRSPDSGAARDDTRGPLRLNVGPDSGRASSMDQTSPLRQHRLFEAFQGVLLRFVHLEHQGELGHDENVLDLLV